MARASKKQQTRRHIFITLASGVGAILLAWLVYVVATTPIPVLQPAGPIAAGQRTLLITAFLLMLIVAVPVFVLLFIFAWRYRASNKKASYQPDWEHSRLIETIWWLVPAALIFVLGLLAWQSSYKYDPYKPLAANHKTLTVQVVALDWRWLFIYPEQQVASVNELQIPVHTPVRFEITADAPMNSFWIPQLGGQEYAMPGMSTRLHLQADKQGRYYGSSANISGAGFADMHFTAVASNAEAFNAWVQSARRQPSLTRSVYDKLAKPTRNTDVLTFSHPADNIYSTIISKYMNSDNHMEGM